ncbi:MAG: threonyl-tRNA synthetase editing domain-containing protein [Armatimonadota bacterium]
MLVIHVDRFRSESTQRGRSPVAEDGALGAVDVGEALLVLACAERDDEPDPAAVGRLAAAETARLARQLKVNAVVIHSFAHLFAQLAQPEAALQVLREMERALASEGFSVARTPFGWFNTMELSAKGHPLSRVARTVRLSEER